MDQTALKAALEELHRESFAWALQCCRRDRVDAEDALQTAYVKVLTGRARFDGRSTFKTWLFSVIRRTAADMGRPRFWERWLGTPPSREPPSEAADPGSALEESEQQWLLRHALAQLPARQREVLLLVFYHEHTIEEAAEVMGIGLGSARTHYARGKDRLRTVLTGLGVSSDD